MPPHRPLITALAVLTIAMLVRGGAMWVRLDGFNDDPDAYRVIAETLAQTNVFGLPIGDGEAKPTAFRPPLYPWMLSFLVDGDGALNRIPVAIMHWVLGSLTVLLTWDITRRLLSPITALIAAALVALDPILIWQSTLVMTETIATFLTMAAWWWWVVRLADSQSCSTSQAKNASLTAAVLGVLLSLAYLCRPTFLVWAVLVIPMLAVAGPQCRIRRSVMVAVGFAVLVGVMATWTMRNRTVMGHPIWATSHGGYTLLLANNDSFYDYLRERPASWPWNSPAWDADPFFAEYASREIVGDEMADDQVAYELAKKTINEQPSMFVYSCWERFVRLWHPFPHHTPGRSTASIVAVGAFYVVVQALILIALFRNGAALSPRHWRRMMKAWPAVALVFTLSAVHAVYWSNPRMRAPANPILAIAASAAFLSKRKPDVP